MPPRDIYHECDNPRCNRWVTNSASFCCGPCVHAMEHHYEIHNHSPFCNQRADDRA